MRTPCLKMARVSGYGHAHRISSGIDQRAESDRQRDGLAGHCDEMHVEYLSAVAKRRPVYEAVLARLQPGDTMVVLHLDRAFRSAIDAITQAERLRSRGIAFHVVQLNVDTRTPTGNLLYQIMAAVFEFDRRMIVQRTKEGLEAARERGARLGRPCKLSNEQVAIARKQLAIPGSTVDQIAIMHGVKPWTLRRALKRGRSDVLPQSTFETGKERLSS